MYSKKIARCFCGYCDLRSPEHRRGFIRPPADRPQAPSLTCLIDSLPAPSPGHEGHVKDGSPASCWECYCRCTLPGPVNTVINNKCDLRLKIGARSCLQWARHSAAVRTLVNWTVPRLVVATKTKPRHPWPFGCWWRRQSAAKRPYCYTLTMPERALRSKPRNGDSP
jgi:hypothetical protein